MIIQLALAASLLPGIVVSDTNSFTCGSAPQSCVVDGGKRILSQYLTSREGKGECHDIIAMTDIPIADAKSAHNFVLCEKGERLCGREVKAVVVSMAFMWKGRFRAVIDFNADSLVWRDWDVKTKHICGEGVFKAKVDGKVVALSPETLRDYLNAKGYTGHNVFKELGDRVVAQARPVWIGDMFYGVLTTSCSQPIIFRCADGETFEFVGVVPCICEYECQLEYLKGKFYAVGRGMKGDNF